MYLFWVFVASLPSSYFGLADTRSYTRWRLTEKSLKKKTQNLDNLLQHSFLIFQTFKNVAEYFRFLGNR